MAIPKKNKKKKFWNFKALDDNTGELTIYNVISEDTWWGDEITPKQFKEDLDALGDVSVLNIYINSPGGDVFAGQSIYSMLARHKAEKHVFIDGLAASMASMVAMVGDVVTMPKNTMMMIHSPETGIWGNAKALRERADMLDKVRVSMEVAYAGKAGDKLSNEKLVEILDTESWLNAEECLEYGFCDVVTEPVKIAACLDQGYLSKYRRTPPEFIAQVVEPPVPTPEPDPTPDPKPPIDALLKQKLLLEIEL